MCMNFRIVPAVAALVVSSVSWQAMDKQISLEPEAWDIRFSYDMPEHPAAEGAGWAFSFPSGSNCMGKSGCPGVHYVTTKYTTPLPADSTLIISFKVEATSDTVFNFKLKWDNTCDGPPASAHAMLERADDDLHGANNRFWSNPIALRLGNGEYTMTIKLSPDQWTNVEGERSPSGFAETLEHMGNIGLTFGGGCFFGHGVNVSGVPARFIMTRLELEP